MADLNPVEITGFLFGIAGVWLTIKKNVWCFPIGIVNVVITAWLVYQQQLFADVLQQVVYFLLLAYGWIHWTRKSTAEERISYTEKNQRIILLFIFVFGSFLMGYLLKTYTQASYPFMDSTGTVICFIAQWMIAFKKLENWYLWIVANIMYVVIYYLKDLPFYSILSFIYLIMAVAGLLEWKKIMRLQNT